MGARKLNHDTRWRYVYFVVSDDLAMVKIGVADCIFMRFDRLRNMSPADLRIAGAIASTRAEQLEQELHEEYDDLRSHGEWFELSGELKEAVDRLSRSDPDNLYEVPMWRDPLGDPYLLPDGPEVF
jgi:hypothetical protein